MVNGRISVLSVVSLKDSSSPSQSHKLFRSCSVWRGLERVGRGWEGWGIKSPTVEILPNPLGKGINRTRPYSVQRKGCPLSNIYKSKSIMLLHLCMQMNKWMNNQCWIFYRTRSNFLKSGKSWNYLTLYTGMNDCNS